MLASIRWSRKSEIPTDVEFVKAPFTCDETVVLDLFFLLTESEIHLCILRLRAIVLFYQVTSETHALVNAVYEDEDSEAARDETFGGDMDIECSGLLRDGDISLDEAVSVDGVVLGERLVLGWQLNAAFDVLEPRHDGDARLSGGCAEVVDRAKWSGERRRCFQSSRDKS